MIFQTVKIRLNQNFLTKDKAVDTLWETNKRLMQTFFMRYVFLQYHGNWALVKINVRL